MFKKLPRTGMRVRIGDLEGIVKVVTPYHMYVEPLEGPGSNVAMELWDDGQVEVLSAPGNCQAVRQQDEWVCPRCTLRWDVNDPEPPACGRSKWTYDSYRQHENRRRGRQVLRGLIDQLGSNQ